jgi:hypothetical protein
MLDFQYYSSDRFPLTKNVIRNFASRIVSKCTSFVSNAYTFLAHTVNVLLFYFKKCCGS